MKFLLIGVWIQTMPVHILIDLSHNENYMKIPDGIFDLEFIFSYVNRGEPFPTFHELTKYNIIIIGDIIPAKNGMDHLFNQEEVRNIKKYVRNGGSLLISSSSGGDFNYKRELGSLRAFSSVSGVDRLWWGELFSKIEGNYVNQAENLVFRNFPEHEIFNDIQKIILADCTFMDTKDRDDVHELLYCYKNTWFRYFEDDFVEKIGSVPIIVTKESDEGKTLVIGSTLFMTDDKNFGISKEDNGKFLKNIVEWLL